MQYFYSTLHLIVLQQILFPLSYTIQDYLLTWEDHDDELLALRQHIHNDINTTLLRLRLSVCKKPFRLLCCYTANNNYLDHQTVHGTLVNIIQYMSERIKTIAGVPCCCSVDLNCRFTGYQYEFVTTIS